MNISIIHPSRGRPKMAAKTAIQFITSACDTVDEYILSLDNDDNIQAYNDAFVPLIDRFETVFTFACADNNNVVDAMNAGAKVSRGDLLVCISDDFEAPDCWVGKITSVIDVTKKEALQINDRYAKPTDIILTMPIITRPLYDELGFVYYPQYTGMFADNDLAELCDYYGYLKKASHIVFRHNHYTNKLNPFDATYQRHNNKKSWDLGKALIQNRRLNGFS